MTFSLCLGGRSARDGLCCLTFELSGRRRYDARPRAQTMCRAPATWAWWHAVGAPLERRVRAHWWRAAVDCGFHVFDSGGAEALRQEQSRYSASAETARALHGASRLASSFSRSSRGEGVCPLVGTSATMTTTQRLPPRAASSCIWTGRLQAGPDQPELPWPTAVSLSRWRCPSPRSRGLDEHDVLGCLRRGRCFPGLCGHGALCALTFELSGRRRHGALDSKRKMGRRPSA